MRKTCTPTYSGYKKVGRNEKNHKIWPIYGLADKIPNPISAFYRCRHAKQTKQTIWEVLARNIHHTFLYFSSLNLFFILSFIFFACFL